MLTATLAAPVSDQFPVTASQTENLPSDEEIFRRVESIQARWSPIERVERRLEADRRFEQLLDVLTGVADAA